MNKYQKAFENIFPPKDWEHKFPQFISVTQTMEIRREDYATLKELVERAIPKKPKEHVPLSKAVYYRCSICNSSIGRKTSTYCAKCGQALDWS